MTHPGQAGPGARPQDLLQRCYRASDLWTAHVTACPACQAWIRSLTGSPCTGGAPLYKALATLQDAYLRQLRTR
ncbi:hypothetical protein [Streptomyces sp. NBC_01237]|uniref:hypothetical protein n=1 Tax=Streptomyces sp. NBC_01237 TaxID=2903790 RepID=UPI002DDAE394|nr:hypothetical protein [Streptomyces sp. NBC_01237]WRZ76584.1 hypothetical protein OG251_35965 [Streptomyces sp. NBC_01237]